MDVNLVTILSRDSKLRDVKMTLKEAIEPTDYSKNPLARDIQTCECAWSWLTRNVISDKLGIDDYFMVSRDNFLEFSKKALAHSLMKLPHRDSSRFGNLSSELMAALDALGENISARSISSLLLSYCGDSEHDKFIMAANALINIESDEYSL